MGGSRLTELDGDMEEESKVKEARSSKAYMHHMWHALLCFAVLAERSRFGGGAACAVFWDCIVESTIGTTLSVGGMEVVLPKVES